MNFERYVEQAVLKKTAALTDMVSGLTGSQGTVNPLAYGLGGAGLGAAAGMAGGWPGALAGGLAGGLMGYGGANAIQQQNLQQGQADNLLAQMSMEQAMGNSPVDQQQNQILQGIVDFLVSGGGGGQPGGGPGAGMGMGQPGMGPGMGPGGGQMDGSGMKAASVDEEQLTNYLALKTVSNILSEKGII